MNKNILLLVLSAFLIQSKAWSKPASLIEQDISTLVTLYSPNKSTRLRAASRPAGYKINAQWFFEQKMAKNEFWNDRREDGTTHVSLRVIRHLGLDSFAPQLIQHLGFSLDSKTFEVGANRQQYAGFPVINTLIGIMNPKVRYDILTHLASTDDEASRRFCVFILKNTENKYLMPILTAEVASHSENDPARNRLQKALELVPDIEENLFLKGPDGIIPPVMP